MAESRSESFSGKNVDVANGEHRHHHHHHHHKETHGLRGDIDVNTPLCDVKAPSVFERAKEEFEAVFHHDEHRHHHHKETHGLREDIDVDTPLGDVKAPTVFERAKEEIEALVEAIHSKKESESHDSGLFGDSAGKDSLKHEAHSEKNFKAPNLIEKAKEEIETLMHKPHHHKETHGMSNDIDENTPTSHVKGPNVFERAREEIEAFIQTIHPKKGSD